MLTGEALEIHRSGMKTLKLDQRGVAVETPLWHKSYFELKAFEFLKSLICLEAEHALTQINCHKSSPRKQPGKTDSYHLRQREICTTPKQTCQKIIYFPSILLKAQLSFLKVICVPISALLPLSFYEDGT